MRGFKTGETSIIKQDEKYNELFRWNGWGSPGNYETLIKPISTTNYDEFWMVGHYAFNSDKGYNALWNSRFLTSIIFDAPSAQYGVYGSDNYLWSRIYPNTVEQDNQNGWCYPCMYIGIKNKNKEQDLLWRNSGYNPAPSTIELSDSIFDYDEICLHFATANGYNLTAWYPTSQLNINDTIYGYNDYDSYINKYTITTNDTLSVVSEVGYSLYAVYGIKDNSMQETVLFTNPSDSTTPATVTLSDAYTNYDEIVLVGHPANDTIKGTQYYPVKALTGFDEMNLTQRIGIFTDVTNCWFSITSTTTLVPDNSYGIVVDKIIGIKRPFLVTAADYADITSLSVNTNGVYTAPSGTAYSPVTVDVQEQPWSPLQDGYSNFWFELTDDTLSPWLNFSAKNNDAVIDWGDGSGEVALDTLTPTHTYSKAGKYVVKVKGVTGIGRQHDVPYQGAYMSVLKYIELNSDVSGFVSYALARCVGLKEIALGNVSSLNSYTFLNCANLQKVAVPNGITVIGAQVLSGCLVLSEVSLPNTLTTINNNAFTSDFALASITIPSTVTSIGISVFASCYSLSEIHMQPTTPPTLGTTPFTSLPSDYIIYVPVGTGETYKAAAGWSAYSDHILEEGQTVTKAMQRKLDNSIDGVITDKLDDIETEEEKR